MKKTMYCIGLSLMCWIALIDDPTRARSFEDQPSHAAMQAAKLLASDGDVGDWFGYSVAISGDTLVVGAKRNDDGGSESGSVYVFERNQGGADTWDEVTELTASDAMATDQFGHFVAISGDTIVVGSTWNNGPGFRFGAAYIFERNHGGSDNWGEVTKLTASDGAADDQFGNQVAISGDTVAVAAFGDDDDGGQSGSAYIFERNHGGANHWGEVRKLIASDADADDHFGQSISISGDTVVVGAFYHSAPDPRTGAAYVFERDQGGTDNWGEVGKLMASDADANDQFGQSISIHEDTIVVGAWYDDENGTDAGAAYIFERNQGGPGSWGEVTKLRASDGAAGDYFGWSASIDGDSVVVGAQNADAPELNSGAAYLFHRNEGGADTWGEAEKLLSSDVAAGDHLGYSVSINSHFTAVGAYADDDLGLDSGSAYLFKAEPATLAIERNIPTDAFSPVAVPIELTSNGAAISSLLFTIDYDDSCLGFDPVDADFDGQPDNIVFSLPGNFSAFAEVTGDPSGELDFVLVDLTAPLDALPDGILATITFTPICTPPALAEINFAFVSFGDTEGQDVQGVTINGSVEIHPGVRGDCNHDGQLGAGDISAAVLEVFDSDGSFWLDVPGGTFPGSPVGCDANSDTAVDAGDVSCIILLAFGDECEHSAFQTVETPVLALDAKRNEVVIYFRGTGISTLTFSLDYDENELVFDSTDRDHDGLPDAIRSLAPNNVSVLVTHDPKDHDGELDIAVIGTDALPSAPMLQVVFPRGARAASSVRFSNDPISTFGSLRGESVEGKTVER